MRGMKMALILACLLSSSAFADGGGPLILFVSPGLFVVTSVFIVLVEMVFIKVMLGVDCADAFKKALVINVKSSFVVGGGVILLAISSSLIGMLAMNVAGVDNERIKNVIEGLGTWVYDNSTAIKYAKLGLLFWMMVSFFATVKYEEALLRKACREANRRHVIAKTAWMMNAATYFLMMAVLAVLIYRANFI